MAEIGNLSINYEVTLDGWLSPIPSVWITPEWLYKDHPIAKPPPVEYRRESEWVTCPSGLLVRSELPIIDADTGPKVLSAAPPLVELGAGMEERPSGLFAPPPPVLTDSMWWGSYLIKDMLGSYTFEPTISWSFAPFTTSPGIGGALKALVPALGTGSAVCPGKGCERAKPKPLDETIIHLNDHHHWSRESIADWLDTLDIDLTVQRKEPADANDRIRGAKFDQVIYDEVIGYEPAPLAAAS